MNKFLLRFNKARGRYNVVRVRREKKKSLINGDYFLINGTLLKKRYNLIPSCHRECFKLSAINQENYFAGSYYLGDFMQN